MADLRSLTQTLPMAATVVPQEFVVGYSCNIYQGCAVPCCGWVVPVGTTWVTFEIWGGGGSGGGGCCCSQGIPGGSGAYAVKSVYQPIIAGTCGLCGCTYTICAGATTPSVGSSCTGCPGCTTWVTGYGLSNFCAVGGSCGHSICCFTCNNTRIVMCCSGGGWSMACGGDINMPGMGGSMQEVIGCHSGFQQWMPMAPATASGPALTAGTCSTRYACCNGLWGSYYVAYWPGGGSPTVAMGGGENCCSLPGSSGLVSVTYG